MTAFRIEPVPQSASKSRLQVINVPSSKAAQVFALHFGR